MTPRTREQNEMVRQVAETERHKQEVLSLQSQLAFLGGLVVGAIHANKLDGLDEAIDHFPYLQTLPSFVAMRQKRAQDKTLVQTEDGKALAPP
jgi:hypothetical protein